MPLDVPWEHALEMLLDRGEAAVLLAGRRGDLEGIHLPVVVVPPSALRELLGCDEVLRRGEPDLFKLGFERRVAAQAFLHLLHIGSAHVPGRPLHIEIELRSLAGRVAAERRRGVPLLVAFPIKLALMLQRVVPLGCRIRCLERRVPFARRVAVVDPGRRIALLLLERLLLADPLLNRRPVGEVLVADVELPVLVRHVFLGEPGGLPLDLARRAGEIDLNPLVVR